MLSQILRLKKNSRGQSLVEFALLLPILLIMMMGIVQFGIIFNAQVQITGAAREGVRLASVGGRPGEVMTLIENITEGTLSLMLSIDDVTLEVKDGDINNLSRGSELTVRIPAGVRIIVPLMDFIFPDSNFPISAQASMRYQRFE